MAVPYRMIDIHSSDKEFEEIMQKYYIDFCKFIGIANMPQLYIYNLSKNDRTVAQMKISEDKYILQTNKLTIITMGQRAIPILYHEFTHIYDDILLYPKITNRMSIIPFTEFHATYIQMMVATGFDSYKNNKKISLATGIKDGVHNCTLREYINQETKYNQTKLAIDTVNPIKSFNYIYYLMLYHIGKMYFAKENCIEDTKQLFDLKPFEDIFGELVYILKDTLFLNHPDKQYFELLSKCQETIINGFDFKYNKTN